MYMLNFVDYVKNFGFSDWLNLVIYNLGFIITFFLIVMLLSLIGFIIYKAIEFINIRISILNLQKELKKLKKGGKK